MHVNYFDLGLCRGEEVQYVRTKLFPRLGITDYTIHGFEPTSKICAKVAAKYAKQPNIHIHQLAVGESNSTRPLYWGEARKRLPKRRYAPKANSLYSTKVNVGSEFESVECVALSSWIPANVPDFADSFNILRMNIEGAEWVVMQDLVERGLHKHIQVFCGAKAGVDILKVTELKQYHGAYMQLLADNGIVIHEFTPAFKPPAVKKLVEVCRQEMAKFA